MHSPFSPMLSPKSLARNRRQSLSAQSSDDKAAANQQSSGSESTIMNLRHCWQRARRIDDTLASIV
ncbi:hypothetical protein Dimus_033888, partial [Dionaea muscipula]